MARPPRGQSILIKAQQELAKTANAKELRILQAVIFPLDYGMSTQETARAIGRSSRWVSKARNEYISNSGIKHRVTQTIRNHAHMSMAEEQEFLAPFLEQARCGGILVVNEVYSALEERLGRKVALSTAYNMLHRHGWRKLSPDKRNVDADIQAQEEWKKNFRNDLPSSKRSGIYREK